MKRASAVGIVVGDMLLVIDRAQPPFGYSLPGGRAEDGESELDCAIRETKEEIGLELPPKQLNFIDNFTSVTGSYLISIYMIEIPFEPELQLSEREIKGFQWVPLLNISKRTDITYAGKSIQWMEAIEKFYKTKKKV